MKRDKAIDTVKELPKEFELESLIEKLVFVEKVEQGLAQLKMGKTVPHEKVKEIVKKW
jgi:predicted transcriptional regulator